MRLTPTFRSIWALLGVVLAIALGIVSAADALIFMLAYNGPLGSYAGQAGDRRLAWHLMIALVILWVLVLAGMLVPALRWRRRGLYATGGAARE